MAAPELIEKVVVTALKSSPDVKAICAGRVFPLKIPQGAKLPAIVYQRVHSSPDHTLAGYTSEGVTIMVNCFAMKYEAAKDLSLIARSALAAAPLHAVFNGDKDLLNEDGNVFCVSANFICQQTGGYCHG